MVELQILSASVRQVLHLRIALKSSFRSPSIHIKNLSIRMKMLLNRLKKRKRENKWKLLPRTYLTVKREDDVVQLVPCMGCLLVNKYGNGLDNAPAKGESDGNFCVEVGSHLLQQECDWQLPCHN